MLQCDVRETFGLSDPEPEPYPVEALIVLGPDGPTSPVNEPCLTSFVSREADDPVCRYVALCLYGDDPTRNCGCRAQPEALPGNPCTLIDCADGTCDPASAACIATGGSPPYPGLVDWGTRGSPELPPSLVPP